MQRSETRVSPWQRVEILEVPVDTVNTVSVLEAVDAAVLHKNDPIRIIAVNPEKVIALRRGSLPLASFASSELLIPDGIGVVWAARLLHQVSIARVAGADLMQEICGLASDRGYSVYIFGGSEEVNSATASVLEMRYPGLRIVGRRNGYFDGKDGEIVDDINASGADILFVALGSPKQENWILNNFASLSVRVIQGIGGTLDTITGHVRRAPVVLQRIHLEWLYRLVMEPSRIRRQSVLPIFAWKVIVTWLRQLGSSVRGAMTG